ncbi:MAG TPA: SLC13 family permease [Blastocatellia bacterium]|nr:SLC13 family permease [Blastocatellia bacterium]
MNPALASVLALLLAIILSMVSRLNIGVLAIALAWIVGVFIAGMKAEAVMAGFPATLFLTLTGVTLLFACAETNGTLKWLAQRAVGLLRGNHRLLPVLFFVIAMVLSTVGPGAIAAVALLVPMAMAMGERAGLPHFLTALMVANGANAGNLSPISALGVIANTKMAEGGVGGHEWKVWFANFIAHALVAAVAYWFLVRKITKEQAAPEAAIEAQPALTRPQILTLVFVLAWIVGVLVFKLNIGLSAFAVVTLLIVLRTTEETQALKKVPWGVIVMVSGVSLLIALLEKTGGMDQFTALIARVSAPATINGIIAFITGVISTYSSTSGVVLPAFLPIASKLSGQIGGGDPLAIALSINVGSSIVDVSPLSTLGALCIAAVSDAGEARVLFRQLLFWGLAMTVVGALFSQLCAGWIARL